MPPAVPAAVRPLHAERDRPQLESFSCRDFRYPWTDPIEEMVREHLADAIESGEVAGLAAVDGRAICAVAAYRIEPDTAVCHCQLLAVQAGHYRRGHGLLLKRAVMAIAVEAEAPAVVSTVYVENDPVIELNRKLGARIVKIPGDPDYVNCVIPLM